MKRNDALPQSCATGTRRRRPAAASDTPAPPADFAAARGADKSIAAGVVASAFAA